MTKYLSKCCRADVKIIGIYGDDSNFACTACNEQCDVIDNPMYGQSIWAPCYHYGSYFKHWFRTFFVCVKCGTVFTKKQIEFYKRFNKQ